MKYKSLPSRSEQKKQEMVSERKSTHSNEPTRYRFSTLQETDEFDELLKVERNFDDHVYHTVHGLPTNRNEPQIDLTGTWLVLPNC